MRKGICFVISGAAAMGVGIFPGDTGIVHGLVALLTNVTSSLSAIAAYRLEMRPFAYISVAIGMLCKFSLNRALLGIL